jgi:hypothetical protein
MVFPNWGAISANIVNSQNQEKESKLIGELVQIRKSTKRDFLIMTLWMVVPAVIIWILFIVDMFFSNKNFGRY